MDSCLCAQYNLPSIHINKLFNVDKGNIETDMCVTSCLQFPILSCSLLHSHDTLCTGYVGPIAGKKSKRTTSVSPPAVLCQQEYISAAVVAAQVRYEEDL